MGQVVQELSHAEELVPIIYSGVGELISVMAPLYNGAMMKINEMGVWEITLYPVLFAQQQEFQHQ